MPLPNGVMIQFFQWYDPYGGVLWNELADRAPDLRRDGFTAVWIPPCYKGAGEEWDVGYGSYDLFDLGEFQRRPDSPGVRTKYGTRDQLLRAIASLHHHQLQVYADVVFNHKDGGDATDDVWAQQVDWNNRNDTQGPWRQIRTWTQFDFPGRGDRYSSFKWRWWHFDAVSHDANDPASGNARLYRLKDKRFSTGVSHEHGNYAYLMACDIDTAAADGELRYWGRWFVDTTAVDGFRIDACKHIRSGFFRDWLNHLRTHFSQRELFAVGEYWSGDVADLHRYLADTQGTLSLFDVPLHYRFHHASRAGSAFDLRTIFDNTLVRDQPAKAVTFVDNHDSQPCQSLESWVEPWFKPHAYALTLLRQGGYPCVFYGDYYDQPLYTDKGREVTLHSHRFLIDRFIKARQTYGFGDQHDYFDHPNTIGWTRLGSPDHPGAMAVLMTNAPTPATKWMNTFRPHARFHDATGHLPHPITANPDGWAEFHCPPNNVSVWLQE